MWARSQKLLVGENCKKDGKRNNASEKEREKKEETVSERPSIIPKQPHLAGDDVADAP